MRVAVIGAGTALGTMIAKECAQRGFAVTPLAPEPSALTAEALGSFDVLADAVLPGAEGAEAVLAALAAAACALPAVRLIALGRADSLYLDADCAATVGEQTDEALEALRNSGADWTVFTPAVQFDPDGVRSGQPILGRDIRILDSAGQSRLSYADAAVAIADEIAAGKFRGKRFTAVSDSSGAVRTLDNNLIDLRIKYMFTRRGAYFGISSDVGARHTGLAYQSARLCIASRRGMPTGDPEQGKDMVYLTPMYRGKELGYAVRMTPTELILTTAYGEIRACMADDHLLLLRGDDGLSLGLSGRMRAREQMKPRGGKAWEGVFRWRCSLVMNPLRGTLDMRAPWDGEKQTTPRFQGVVEPDADGRFLLAVDESIYAGKLRETYPDYDGALADVTADWEGFLAKIPPVDPPLENARLEAAWCLWSYLLNPSGYVRRPHIMMAASSIASAWQMNHNAAALRDDLPLAIDLVSNMFDGIGALGQLPDMVDDGRCMAQAIHPPTQGWALLWIAQKHDLAKELPREKIEFLYDGFRRWASWFFLARDDDRDGLPQYDNGDEIGFDDCSPFQFHTTLVTPDLSAYLVLLYDGLALMAEALGMPEKAKDWTRRGDTLTQRMLDTLWNGERFVAVTNGSHEVVATDSVVYYLPLVLGKRLPQDVIDKMTADLMVEGDFLTPFGLCVEKLESEFFRLSGMSRGWVLPASNLLIATGMYNAGKVAEAKLIARRYCDACAKWGISMLLDPIRGTPNGFACSWSANTFLVLADLACNL